MEKLFKVVCANFALTCKKPLKCYHNLEDNNDDALIMFVGLALKRFDAKTVCDYLNAPIKTVHECEDKFLRKKSTRFNTKMLLIQNGMKL